MPRAAAWPAGSMIQRKACARSCDRRRRCFSPWSKIRPVGALPTQVQSMGKPTRRQIVFNWLMAEPDFATKSDGYWGGQEDVDRIDALLAALDSANDGEVKHG